MVNFEHCLGCHSCELACAVSHSESLTLFSVVLSGGQPPVTIRVASGGGLRFPLQRRHCTDAKCLKACMTGVIRREQTSGAVLCDAAKCIGC